MKAFLGILGILIFGYMAHSMFPWWSIAIIAGIVGAVLNNNGWKSFLMGFFGVLLLWSLSALFINSANEGILSNKLGELLGGLSGFSMILVTGIIGGLVGGFGALTGALGRKLFD